MRRLRGGGEILIVDDGSSDDTASYIGRTFPDVRLICLPRNSGKGAAVRAGMRAARGRFRFFVDADLPYDLDVLPVMLRYLEFKEFDVVIGSREPADSRGLEQRTIVRRAASAVFTSFVSRIVVTGVKDTQCGFKGFRADAADYLFGQSRVNRFAFDVELLYLAYKNNMDIKRVPVRLVREDASSVSVVRDGLRMGFDIFTIPFRYYTGRYVMRDTVSTSEAPD